MAARWATAALQPHLGATNMQPSGLAAHDTSIPYLARAHGTAAATKPRKRVTVRKPARGPFTPTPLPPLQDPPPAIDVSKLGIGNASEVFDQMPASANFVMSMMSISVCIDDISYSMPNSQVQDVVDLFGTPFDKKGQRSASYTMGEDEALVMAQENVKFDATMGNDHTGANYWKDIKEENHHNVKTLSYQDELFWIMLCIWMLCIDEFMTL